MTGAMYAGIAGLKTHMQNLNVIGHNIANVNTNSYKAERSVFRTALYTQLSGGRDGTVTQGSRNISQIGYGSNLATVGVDMSTGGYSPGNPTDVMIDGDGFFMVGDKDVADVIDTTQPNRLTSLTLTRVGDFEFGEDSYLSDGQGNVVYGFLVIGTIDGNPIYSDQLVPIRLPRQDELGRIKYPQLQEVTDPVTQETRLKVVDNTGVGGEDAGNDDERVNEYVFAKMDSITIADSGQIYGTTKETGEMVVIGAIALGTVDNPNGVTHLSNSYYKCGAGSGDLAVNMVGGLAKSAYIATRAITIPDGTEADADQGEEVLLPTMGQITDQGISLGRAWYVNGSQVTDGNEQDGNTFPRGSQVFDGGAATFRAGGLEMSKTDLATEIANMITTQRGYQANTRVITVTDTMLEELVNMKR